MIKKIILLLLFFIFVCIISLYGNDSQNENNIVMENDTESGGDNNSLVFGLYVNPLISLFYAPLVGAEVTWHYFNADFFVFSPSLNTLNSMTQAHNNYTPNTFINGFGAGGKIGFFFPNRFGGGIYLGTMVFFLAYDIGINSMDYDNLSMLLIGVNSGYKLVFSSGLYFRIGIFLGGGFIERNEYRNSVDPNNSSRISFRIYPDITIGYSF